MFGRRVPKKVPKHNAGMFGSSPNSLGPSGAWSSGSPAGAVTPCEISQDLGHSNTAVTETVYAWFAPDHLRDAAEVLEFGRIRAEKEGRQVR